MLRELILGLFGAESDSRQAVPPDSAIEHPSTLDEAKIILIREGYVFQKIRQVPEDLRSRLRDGHAYGPVIHDWEMFLPFVDDVDLRDFLAELAEKGGVTLVSPDRLYVLKSMLLQTINLRGEIWETGTYKGGTALFFRRLEKKYRARPSKLRLFDTFKGMPETHAEKDVHKEGHFKDTTLESVQNLLGQHLWISYHSGIIPNTFAGREKSRIRFAHIDLDIYQAILDATAFIYPRLVAGGVMVFDDYGFFSCPGARDAVDEFFADKPEQPLVLTTGQAIVTKL